MKQNNTNTFDTVTRFTETHQTKSQLKFDLPGLTASLKKLGVEGYFYLKQVEESIGTIYYTKFISPNLYMHMNNSRHINAINRFSSTFDDLILESRANEMVPFP